MCFINGRPKTEAEEFCRKDLRLAIEVSKNAFLKSKKTKIALSHIPFHRNRVNSRSKDLLKGDVLSLELDFIFSGHIHHEAYSTHALRDDESIRSRRLTHEITIPTCSYRMGETHQGVGVAIIGE